MSQQGGPPHNSDSSDFERKVREFEQRRQQGATRPHPAMPPPSPVPQTPSHPPKSAAARKQGGSGVYVPWWGFALMAAVVVAATCGLWAFVFVNRPNSPAGSFGGLTPTFVVITDTPGPSLPEALLDTATPVVVTATTNPELIEPTEVRDPGEISPGDQVVVFGTEGQGLALRQGPGTGYAYFPELVAQDGEVLVVEDGPRLSDGYTWWLVSDPDNPDRFGWAAETFLQKVFESGPLQEATPDPSAGDTTGGG